MRKVALPTVVTTAVVAAFLLAGCSSPQASKPSTSATQTTAAAPKLSEHVNDTWTFKYKGATGSFKLASNDTQADVQSLEALRTKTGGDDATFVPVTIDNSKGATDLNMYQIVVVTKDKQQIESQDISDILGAWGDKAVNDTDLFNETVDATNKYGLFDLKPGAAGTAIVAFSKPITSATLVYVYPNGGDDAISATASK